MKLLARQQAALLAALLDWPAQAAECALQPYISDPGGLGLAVYQSNGHALARRALQQAYPVVHSLLGEDSFAALARALWHAAPPLHGDVGLWGGALADFAATDTQLQELPYLPDLARVEWALHQCVTAADVPYRPDSLTRLSREDPLRLGLDLAPGLCWLASPWPVVSVLGAHREGEPTMAQAARALQQQWPEEALVWRAGFSPRLRQTLPGEVLLLRALQQGQSLSQALDAAPALDFGTWLPQAVHTGLVLGVCDVPTG